MPNLKTVVRRIPNTLLITYLVCLAVMVIFSGAAFLSSLNKPDPGDTQADRAIDYCLTQVIPAQAAPDETHFLHVIYTVTGPSIYKVSGRVHRVNPQGAVDRSGVFTCTSQVLQEQVTLIDSSLN
jgi:hypothetical protein